MAVLISAQSLSKSFSGKQLFKDISFGIDEGQRIGLIGPNGAGKSSLVKILIGELKADSGLVTKRKGLKVGYLDQLPQFSADATIYSVMESSVENPDEEIGDIYEWLGRLDLIRFGEHEKANNLSGGWQKRLALASQLIKKPDVLFLDEPTNHLDMQSILWLEEFISNQQIATVTITHDRLFLTRVANVILDLDPRNPEGLLVVNGDYVKFLESKELILSQQRSIEEKMKNTFRRETEWLRRGAKARQTKQKARIERAGDLGDNLKEVSARNANKALKIDFGDPEKQPKKLVELKNVSLNFTEKAFFKDINLIVSPQTRLGLIGSNGAGKSTFIKLIVGKITPTQGSVTLAERLDVSYFEQNKETLEFEKSVLKNICPEGDYVSYQGKFIHARSYLYKFKFHTNQLDLPVAQLSGGEKSRLRLAQMLLSNAGLIILDEPTNDLDIETLEVLEDALTEFSGAVILISHDRYFMDQVASKILYIDDRSTSGTRQLEYFSDYLQWEEWIENTKFVEKVEKTEPIKISESTPAPKKKIGFKEKNEWSNLETEIAALEAKIASLQSELSTPAVLSSSSKLIELTKDLESQQKALELKFERWAELAPLFENN
jgi:ABC transport system ATP-binding/permease protein